MEKLKTVLVYGLSTGCLYGLIAIGYSMVYSIIGLINFAHGDLFMLGCFFALTVVGLVGIDPSKMNTGDIIGFTFLLILATSAFCALVNYALYKIVYQPLRNSPKLILLVSAIGVSLIFQNIGMLWGGIGPEKVMGPPKNYSAPKSFPDISGRGKEAFGEDSPVPLTDPQLLIFLVTLPTVIGLDHIVRRTKVGTSMRACEQDTLAAQLMGIDPIKVIATTFIIGGFLAGTASVVSCYYVGTVQFQMGYTAGLYAFTAAVVGGIGSIWGAMLGGLLLGFIKTIIEAGMIKDWVGVTIPDQWVNTLIFTLLILFLIFRPSGILGYKAQEKV